MAGEQNDYFCVPHWINIIWVPLGMLNLSLAYLKPDALPYDYMGPIGTATAYVVNEHPKLLVFLFYFGWSLHVLEGAIAFFVTRSKNMTFGCTALWTAQTFIYGYFSLGYLVAFDPKKKAKRV